MTTLRNVLAVLLLSWGASLPAQEVDVIPFRPQEEIAPNPQAARVFSTFSKAWVTRDAGQIAALVPEEGRASVTIESRGVSSQMSRGQIQSLLAGLFANVQRTAFALSRQNPSDEASAYAVGDWRYELDRPKGVHRETVFIVLRRTDPGAWILSELRVQPVR